ncbi:MAG: hypothetical protein A2568_03460 [Candidatus Yanofskybacteria bacterium RIFOXYD1_FULL_44_17]|uniref:Filamentous hemagglutinin family outer membrane protein n=1 Tax=Candidatus Yanofskybacteria bacterium GW2011_GWE2_40_11 TaxID=1619033 RepID=A0A0G0QK36_9BACT|nr:MAG: Filamentous hemagglutinin family outer membrane protein [Candidatus Yanofskybacteria bacterium GW2011_GWE1_40_10]KKR40724.1 MAG: Filamentous hemagglutinin family outer membrane protein [Candidatus Yanofskybacteria bacterium GW2011_GWE2_40_11]OGN36007.1 MAG: hypothetical protein A2207_03040 [Candidatus Yanofskybacteria bacterium RIFOXYA1_FULL_44_17]OGN36391.1 MAG: hypothetical protein A2241_01445 [Candidatus Yanofskybacteria bacterium RIFOXYA2_FULL_45_28]OGN37430.1 MAG: hypothetical prot
MNDELKKSFSAAILIVSVSIWGFGWLTTSSDISASTNQNYTISNGFDDSSDVSASFSAIDISKLSANDNTRIQSNEPWPNDGTYDESKYLEFIFSPNIAGDSTINSVSISHKYRRSGALAGAKLEIWDGVDFSHQLLLTTEGALNNDVIDNFDLTDIVNSVSKINNLKIRFLAFRNPSAETHTSHDLISLSVGFDGLESTPSSSPTPSSSYSPTPEPSSSPTATPSPVSSPSPSPTSTSEPGDVSDISVTNITILRSSAIADGNFDHGWKWAFDITVPMNQEDLSLKFDDWSSGSNIIATANNVRIYSVQSSNADVPNRSIIVNNSGTYSNPMKLSSDLDAVTAGRQVQVVVEVRIPPGSIGGPYYTNYGFQSI